MQAEGYTPDGQRRKRQKKKRKQRQNVDQSAVKENIQRVMAELKGGSSKKRRRKEPSLTKEQREAAEEEARQEEERERTTVRVNEFLTVSELSELVEVPATELMLLTGVTTLLEPSILKTVQRVPALLGTL